MTHDAEAIRVGHAGFDRFVDSGHHALHQIDHRRPDVELRVGQKQRISIARALIKEPSLIIFDDCLSAVDVRTEKEIIANLYDYLKDRTAIIITHRIFSLFHFDKIVVLEEGEIVEQGTHDELLARNGFYTTLYARQQEQEEQSV